MLASPEYSADLARQGQVPRWSLGTAGAQTPHPGHLAPHCSALQLCFLHKRSPWAFRDVSWAGGTPRAITVVNNTETVTRRPSLKAGDRATSARWGLNGVVGLLSPDSRPHLADSLVQKLSGTRRIPGGQAAMPQPGGAQRHPQAQAVLRKWARGGGRELTRQVGYFLFL